MTSTGSSPLVDQGSKGGDHQLPAVQQVPTELGGKPPSGRRSSSRQELGRTHRLAPHLYRRSSHGRHSWLVKCGTCPLSQLLHPKVTISAPTAGNWGNRGGRFLLPSGFQSLTISGPYGKASQQRSVVCRALTLKRCVEGAGGDAEASSQHSVWGGLSCACSTAHHKCLVNRPTKKLKNQMVTSKMYCSNTEDAPILSFSMKKRF